MRIVAARHPSDSETGFPFAVHSHGDAHVSKSIAETGIWEPFETMLFTRLVRSICARSGRRPRVIDCGANIGWYTIVGARIGADVLAVEPMPANATLLRENVSLNNVAEHVRVVESALGSRSGRALLHLSETNQGDHRLHVGASNDPAKERPTIAVPVQRLDSLGELLPDLIKLDTQGSEVSILRGAEVLWRHNASVVLLTEFWPYGLDRCGSSAEEFLELLRPLIDTTHQCFEVREWSRELVPHTSSTLAALIATEGFSLRVRGFTNLLVVPHDIASTVLNSEPARTIGG